MQVVGGFFIDMWVVVGYRGVWWGLVFGCECGVGVGSGCGCVCVCVCV